MYTLEFLRLYMWSWYYCVWNITCGAGFIRVGHQTGQEFQGPVHNLLCVEKFINLTDPAMARYVTVSSSSSCVEEQFSGLGMVL